MKKYKIKVEAETIIEAYDEDNAQIVVMEMIDDKIITPTITEIEEIVHHKSKVAKDV